MRGNSLRFKILLALLIGLALPITSAHSEDFPVKIAISHGAPDPNNPGILLPGELIEEFFLADHTSDLNEGNWIELMGGVSIKLPRLTFQYGGPLSVAAARDGKRIDFRLTFMSKRFSYPLTSHQLYYPGDIVTAIFHGSNVLGGESLEARLIRAKLRQITEALKKAVDEGNTHELRALLDSTVWRAPITLDDNGDAIISFKVDEPGQYMLIIVKEVNVPHHRLYLYSLTPIIVLRYGMTVSAPDKAELGRPVLIRANLINASPSNYRYGAILIHEDAYQVLVRMRTSGRCPQTTITLNNALLLKGVAVKELRTFKLFGVGLEKVDEAFLVNWLAKALGANKISISLTDETKNTSVIIPLMTDRSMPEGRYILLIVAWKPGAEGDLVALYQGFITLTASQ